MPLRGIRTSTAARNGAGAFILQCKRLDFHYCNWAGSSKGMCFLGEKPPAFARETLRLRSESPPTQKHPLIKGLYINGREKPEASGEKLKRVKKPVTSLNESVRGIWSPYHGDLRGV
ncbi:hypothetical protein PDIDSM_8826 [Penicillium digitatum]|nr:hypothetical protein PDIDSM_8826 [Penicillium digitatum]